MKTTSEQVGKVETPDLLQTYILRTARSMRDPNIRVGTSHGIAAADEKTLSTIKDEFEFDLEGEPLKTSERYGGMAKGGFYDELHQTNQEGVYLELTFNSRDGLERRRPSAMSLVRLDLEDKK